MERMSEDPGAGSPTPGVPTRPAVDAPDPPVLAADVVHALHVDGRLRTYLLHVPPAVRAQGERAPLLLALHPGYGSAAGFARTTGFSERADAFGYVVAYPAGLYRSWNAGDCCGPPAREGVDDVAFLLAVVTDVARHTPIDAANVFVAGFSNGAGLALLLGCRRAERVRAIVAGGSPLHVPLEECAPSRPVPLFTFHGLADPVAPYDGGRGILANIGDQQSSAAMVDRWRSLNRCGAGRRIARHARAVVETADAGPDGAEVVSCTIEGMGHQWPGGAPYETRIFGPGSTDVSATDLAMAFFERHRLRQPS
jgi:polyhydroxybutyrate depolymerase